MSDVVSAYSDLEFLGPARLGQARARFETWRIAEEEGGRELPFVVTSPSLGGGARPILWAFAASFAVLLGIVGWNWSRARDIDPAPILAEAEALDQDYVLSALPVIQEFQLELRDLRDPDKTERTALLIAADGSKRFAARWRDSNRDLKLALLRDQPDREIVYNPRVGAVAVDRSPARTRSATLANLDVHVGDRDAIESVFVNWMENREWRPLSLALEFAAFAGGDRVVLKASRLDSGDGQPGFRLAAVRADMRMIAELRPSYSSGKRRLRLVSLQIGSPRASLSFVIRAERSEMLPVAHMETSVFEADFPTSRAARRVQSVPPKLPPKAKVGATSVEPALASAPAALDIANAEIEARYLLHRLGACLGEPITVETDGGRLRVHGIVDTDARRDELRAALNRLGGEDYVEISIQAVSDVSNVMDLDGLASHDETDLFARLVVNTVPSPIQAQLERYFRNRPTANGVSRNVSELANRSFALSASARDHAWAIRRLAQWHESKSTVPLEPRSQWLLQIMMRDHLAVIQDDASRLRGHLDSPFSAISDGTNAPGLPGGAIAANWEDSSAELLRTVNRLARLIQGLLAGGELPLTRESELSGRDGQVVIDPLVAVAEVRATLLIVGQATTELEAQFEEALNAEADPTTELSATH